MLRFFSPQYYFDLSPSVSGTALKVMLVIFACMVIAGIVVKVYEKLKTLHPAEEKLLGKYFSMLVVMGFVGILIAWFRYEGAYFLSMRFWLLVWLVGIIIWLMNILQFQLKVVPEAKKQTEQKKIFTKYLPKRK